MALDDEIMWAESGTGDTFQCVHVDFAREQQAKIDRLTAFVAKVAEVTDSIGREAAEVLRNLDS